MRFQLAGRPFYLTFSVGWMVFRLVVKALPTVKPLRLETPLDPGGARLGPPIQVFCDCQGVIRVVGEPDDVRVTFRPGYQARIGEMSWRNESDSPPLFIFITGMGVGPRLWPNS